MKITMPFGLFQVNRKSAYDKANLVVGTGLKPALQWRGKFAARFNPSRWARNRVP